ncbi:MAG: hypothetical protein AAGF11_09340 [Myxococcota bacterium]
MSIAIGACAANDDDRDQGLDGSGLGELTMGSGGQTGTGAIADGSGGSGGSGGSADGSSADDEGSGSQDPKLDIGTDAGPPGDPAECATLSEQAEVIPTPADIIFVVDNSGSMTFEASQVQARMNDFSDQIIASGVDARVILVSSYPDDGNGICIDPPLGGGGCPQSDDNSPAFTHVDQKVGSHDAWEDLLATHGQWANVIRPDSIKHIVVVTDDTSHIDRTSFSDDLVALDPAYQGFLHHSVVCHSDCQSAAGIGEEYIALSQLTGGVAADLCDQDFQAVFDVLSTEVIGGSQLSCEFEIPPPPVGMEFDPDEVNLEFDDGQGNTLPIGRVDLPAGCADVIDGWHYDDPMAPTTIVMCPQTCDKLQDSFDGSVRIEFGCATTPAG